jgi:rhodanese-related sulfurtransferase
MKPRIPGVVIALVLLTAGAAARPQKVDPNDSSTIARITLMAFQPLQEKGKVLVVDVREPHAVEAGRIPGAINVPLFEVGKRIAEIKKKADGRRIVAYCSCPAEHTAAEALLILHNRGMKNVSALVGGYTEWVRAGGKVERVTTDVTGRSESSPLPPGSARRPLLIPL